MRVTETARALGVSADWLRSLEAAGRIPRATRDCNGWRRYSPQDVERIRRALFVVSEAEGDEAIAVK